MSLIDGTNHVRKTLRIKIRLFPGDLASFPLAILELTQKRNNLKTKKCPLHAPIQLRPPQPILIQKEHLSISAKTEVGNASCKQYPS